MHGQLSVVPFQLHKSKTYRTNVQFIPIYFSSLRTMSVYEINAFEGIIVVSATLYIVTEYYYTVSACFAFFEVSPQPRHRSYYFSLE